MVTRNYDADIRILSDEYRVLTGAAAFRGVSLLGRYDFDLGDLGSGTEAFAYMEARLKAARDHTPEPEFPQ